MRIFSAVAFAAMIVVPFVAASATDRETVSIKVHYGDLDLHRADHRAMLDARIRRAAVIACGPITSDLRQNMAVEQCRNEMRADAATKLVALTQGPVMVASNH